MLSELKCWAAYSEGCVLAQAHLEVSAVFVLSMYFGNAVISCFLYDYCAPVSQVHYVGLALSLAYCCVGDGASPVLCVSQIFMCIKSTCSICKSQFLFPYTGPCSPSKQLGELLHGDPDGNRSPGLHHELHHWEEQKQPPGSCLVQHSQGAARK